MEKKYTTEELAKEPLFQLSEEEFFALTATCVSDYISVNYPEFGTVQIELYMFQIMLAVQLAQGNTDYVNEKTSSIKEEFYDNAITV